ncbi:uncharacterized protein MYCGRDRAFT_33464 [Zymoseptoria tritici IPO323]|uniref:Uncharacterized protein n=1 Tax=Zymoseptoria tritici (strain CBS 115943 / IPO323) TaxID=336722 RepID=F9WXL8_ZYMTI|nr:uncharacterized protein MYCGRDRAFT_33464 [Zymoseptoria tritici IPO323]EGP92632.1 hypothetical protein MYCGRDRAFT_33464 [Zymoseptoria tritici IPO323]
MALDEPSAQLNAELRSSVVDSLASRRPVLHHLNDDTTWLLQIPRPEAAVRHGARLYYNILIDPWFRGGQTDIASWFSRQFHATPSAVQSIAELEELIREVERSAMESEPAVNKRRTRDLEDFVAAEESLIDAIAINHEFTDHCHKETLLEVNRNVPIFAWKEAVKMIESWKHFRSVTAIVEFGSDCDSDWRNTSIPPLPEWIGISRLTKSDLHAAMMITFNNRHDESAEALIYTPHGLPSSDFQIVRDASPPISCLALLHGLHNVRLGTATGLTALQINLGSHNGLRSQRMLNADYWIGTHDEDKKGRGLIAWFLQRDILTVRDALLQEFKARRGGKGDALDRDVVTVLDSFEAANWVDLRNGESHVLL